MNNREILETIRMRRKKCVGIAFHRHKVYYAISGDDIDAKTNSVAKEIEKIIGKNPLRCTIENSFTMIAYWNSYMTSIVKTHYMSVEDSIYNNLKLFNNTTYIFTDYLDSAIRFRPYMRTAGYFHSIRNYSCVERKIIGRIKEKKIEIYVGTNPCYYCLPVVRKVKYISRETNKLETLSVTKRINKFTYSK